MAKFVPSPAILAGVRLRIMGVKTRLETAVITTTLLSGIRRAAISGSCFPVALIPPRPLGTGFYPRVHLLRDGRLFIGTPIAGKNRIYDPFVGTLSGPEIDRPENQPENLYDGWPRHL